MSADPRGSLSVLVAALERHLEACATRGGEDDPAVVAAYDDLADAFQDYDEALYEAYGEMTPLDIYNGSEDDEDDDEDAFDGHDDEDGGSDGPYAGLDDADFDED
jgi:hypothetical protein